MNYKKKILYSQFVLMLALITILLPAIGNLTDYVLGDVANKKALDLTILGISIAFLAVNGIVIMFIIHKVMKPVQQIIKAIQSYKEGKEESLPQIFLQEGSIEFTQLATTINSLTDQIRKQISFLKRQRGETEEILESIGEGIIAVDPSARVIFANQAACRMLGLLKEQMIGRTLDSIETENKNILKKCHELIVHALQTAEPAGHTWIVREKGTFYHDLNAAPLAHKDGALLVLQDKTSDYRIVELGKDFIANASHELKTPITIIRGFAETLHDLPELSDEMLRQITGKIVKTCGRLDKLVQSLLSLTDIEQVSVKDFGKVDLVAVLSGCIEMMLAVHSTAIVRFESESLSAEVLGDASLLELAVMNILENAVKYSQDFAEVDILVTSTNDEVRIQFKDKGIGISENDLPQIFERFYTVDKARSRKKGGAGLGLSIVKTVLDKHQGKVVASSQLGKGSSFTFVIPKK
ncbi:MAG: PAS domain-containing protein [Parachlamydiales bacterium]|nr:PAS domain-containing protein [Parachlamydiales bacterium]